MTATDEQGAAARAWPPRGAGREAGPLAPLARIRRQARPPAPLERCELCSAILDPEQPEAGGPRPMGAGHRHLVDLQTRSLRCACRACALLFTHPGAGGGRYRVVPERWRAVRGFSLSQASWDSLQIPVGVAFVLVSSTTGEPAAFYPGPAGATECMLPLGAWEEMAGAHEELASMEPDVEAALIVAPSAATAAGGRDGAAECFVVPVDACYELVGLLRRTWRGFDGGSEARETMREFFSRVRSRSGSETADG